MSTMNMAQTNRRLLHSQLQCQGYDSRGRGSKTHRGASQIPSSIRGSRSRREETPSKQARNIEHFPREHIRHRSHMMSLHMVPQASRLVRCTLLCDRPALRNLILVIHLSTGATSTHLHCLPL